MICNGTIYRPPVRKYLPNIKAITMYARTDNINGILREDKQQMLDAFDQTRVKNYARDLEDRGVSDVVRYAIAFSGKNVEVSLDDYPLLMYVDEIINQGAEVDIPWEKFTRVVEK